MYEQRHYVDWKEATLDLFIARYYPFAVIGRSEPWSIGGAIAAVLDVFGENISCCKTVVLVHGGLGDNTPRFGEASIFWKKRREREEEEEASIPAAFLASRPIFHALYNKTHWDLNTLYLHISLFFLGF